MWTRLRLRLLEWRIKRLKHKIGGIMEARTIGDGPVSWYMGTNYHHPLYSKLQELQAQVESETTWTAPWRATDGNPD